jgi:release factor glutamine methyltransferase
MFVKDNSLLSVKSYFYDRLNHFSESELKNMWTEIVCKRFNWSRSDLLMNADFRLSESDLLFVRSYVKRLQENEPFQYILGETEFYGLTIKCDKRALIPRPETEELVDWISENSTVQTIIDICSGSGCIALGLKSYFKNAKVLGVDISQQANDLARENAEINNLEVVFHSEDVFNSDSDFWSSLSNIDLIVSNPPYIPKNEQINMEKNVLDFEPHLALFVSDNSPIIFYERIADLAIQKLRNGGYLYFELHHLFSQQVELYLKKVGFKNIELKNDLQGKIRMLKAQK